MPQERRTGTDFQQAVQDRKDLAGAIEKGVEYRRKLTLDEAAFLLQLPKQILLTHFIGLTVRTDDGQIALVHCSNSRDMALEGLKLWAQDQDQLNKRAFSSLAYDHLYDITQGAFHSLGKSVVQGENGLVLDALAQLSDFSKLEPYREFLEGNQTLGDDDYQTLSECLQLLWNRLDNGQKKDKNGRWPGNVFR